MVVQMMNVLAVVHNYGCEVIEQMLNFKGFDLTISTKI